MPSFPTPTPAATTADLRAFFNTLAADPTDRHGPPRTLLANRLRILNRHAQFTPSDLVLDIGCGDGAHLRALVDRIDRGIGIDLSPRMITTARQQTTHPDLSFHVDDAERLTTIPSSTVDKVLCVGMLEHVLRPSRVLRQVNRVLTPGGRFVALTLNGAYWWYRLADSLALPTRHLTTDHRLEPEQGKRLLQRNGLFAEIGFWSFVPTGDLPTPLSALCHALDRLGQRTALSQLRGGLRLSGRAP